MVRPEERETRQDGEKQRQAEWSAFTPEQRDKLLGRNRDATDRRKPDRSVAIGDAAIPTSGRIPGRYNALVAG